MKFSIKDFFSKCDQIRGSVSVDLIGSCLAGTSTDQIKWVINLKCDTDSEFSSVWGTDFYNFNCFMTGVPNIEKPIHWFALKTNGLVYKWWTSIIKELTDYLVWKPITATFWSVQNQPCRFFEISAFQAMTMDEGLFKDFVKQLWRSLFLLARPMVNIFAKSLVNMLAETLVNMFAESLLNAFTKAHVNILVESLVKMFAESLANMLAGHWWLSWSRYVQTFLPNHLWRCLPRHWWTSWSDHWWSCLPSKVNMFTWPLVNILTKSLMNMLAWLLVKKLV